MNVVSMFLCTFLSSVWAQPIVLSSEIIDIQIGATWSFPIVQQDNLYIAMGQQGDLWVAPMEQQEDGSWDVEMEVVFNMSNQGEIVDHALRQCPDGTFIHVACTEIEADNLFYTYDEDFEFLSTGTLSQSDPPHAANDPSAICGEQIRAFGVAELSGERDFFWLLGEFAEGSSPRKEELIESPRLTGAGVIEQEDHFAVIGHDNQGALSLQTYDFALRPINRILIPFAETGIVNYWPSSIIHTGAYIAFAAMGRNPQHNWPADTGNVYLGILDREYNLLSWHQLTDFIPSEGGGMRPFLIHANHQLLVSFDRNNKLYLINIEIDHASFGLDAPLYNDESSLEEEGSSNQDQTSDGYLGIITSEDEVGCRNSKNAYLFIFLFLPLIRRYQDTAS